MQKYAQAGFGIGILTKLGSFCVSHLGFAGPERCGSMAGHSAHRRGGQDVQDMQQRYGLRKVFFIDNGFNVPLPHAKELCQALLAAHVKGALEHLSGPLGCDRELIGLMKQAGCALVLMGGMRGDPHDMAPCLGERVVPMLETRHLCEEQDLHYTLAVAFGEPGETRATVEEKLDFLRSIKPAIANLRIGVNILPGTPIAARALAEGRITDEAELIKPTFLSG